MSGGGWRNPLILRIRMRIAIYLYMVFYLCFAASILRDDFKSSAPLWEMVSDLILLPLGFAGMAFYQFGVGAPLLKTIWMGVSVLLLVGHFASDLYSSHQVRKGETDIDPKELSKAALIAADITSIITVLPSIALNFLFAYS